MGLLDRIRPNADRAAAPSTNESLPEATPISDVIARSEVTVRGTITRIKAIPKSGMPSLAVTIDDGTATATAIWSGRRAIGGVTLGRRIDLSGTAVSSTRGFEFYNPRYTLRES
jgi:RecG-like helicase